MIGLLEMPQRNARHFAGKALAVNAGYELVSRHREQMQRLKNFLRGREALTKSDAPSELIHLPKSKRCAYCGD
jgi:hypothetical protein